MTTVVMENVADLSQFDRAGRALQAFRGAKPKPKTGRQHGVVYTYAVERYLVWQTPTQYRIVREDV